MQAPPRRRAPRARARARRGPSWRAARGPSCAQIDGRRTSSPAPGASTFELCGQMTLSSAAAVSLASFNFPHAAAAHPSRPVLSDRPSRIARRAELHNCSSPPPTATRRRAATGAPPLRSSSSGWRRARCRRRGRCGRRRRGSGRARRSARSGKKLPYSMAARDLAPGLARAPGGGGRAVRVRLVRAGDAVRRALPAALLPQHEPRPAARLGAPPRAGAGRARAQADSLRGVRRRASLLLRCPTQRLTHRAAGYDIDGLTAALARSRPPTARGRRRGGCRRSTVARRGGSVLVGWDSEVSGGPASFSVSLAEAPPNAAATAASAPTSCRRRSSCRRSR